MVKNLIFFRYGSHKKARSFIPEILYLSTAILSGLFWNRSLGTFGGIVLFTVWLVILLLLFSLATINLENGLLLDKLTRPLTVIIIVFQFINAFQLNSGSVLWEAILGGLILGGVPYLVFQITKGAWIGGGDVKLAFAAGLLLGPRLSILCILLMFIFIGLAYLLTFIVGRVSKNPVATKIETGILWTPAIIICMLFGTNYFK